MKGVVFSKEVAVAIDIGTTKICVLVARCVNEQVEILGIGKAPSDGLKKGVVVDVGRTVESIKAAVKEAEIMAGMPIEHAYIGISGGHIQSRSSQGMVLIKNGEVRATDIAQVITAARAIVIPEGQQVLHVLPQYFTLDSLQTVTDPLGMYAVRLEAQVHIITGSIASVQNLMRCCELAGIKVVDIILEQLASAYAVLSTNERQLGVAMLDIGGGTSDLALYHNNSIKHTMVLPVAGNHFTQDLAIGLQTTLHDAERVKKEYGLVYEKLLKDDGCIELASVNGLGKHIVLQSEVVSILEARAQEVLYLVYQDIQKNNLLSFIPTGLVLTGGGALLGGINTLAEIIFKGPIRIGNPQLESPFAHMISSPIYATAYGLLLHALKKQDTATVDSLSGPLVLRVFTRMKSWVADFF